MSPKRTRIRPFAENNHTKTGAKRTGSDNGCDVNRLNRIRTRAPRVGLCSGRGRRYSNAELLAARTVKGPSCWTVTGYQNPHNGYINIRREKAHRIAYELAYGPIPEGMKVCHRCDNPRCVNPDHLFLGSQKTNIHDCIHKSRRNAFGRQKLHPSDVRQIRQQLAMGWRQWEIAARFGVTRSAIASIATGATWAHLSDDALPAVFERVSFVHLPVVGTLALKG